MPNPTYHVVVFRLAVALAFVPLNCRVGVTQTVQKLEGTYLGITTNLEAARPLSASMLIDSQENRQFDGLLDIEAEDGIGTLYKSVIGTIAASGNCVIQADGLDGKSVLSLDWTKIDSAGLLVGKVVINHEEQFRPLALLRPFSDLSVNWGGGVTISMPVKFMSAFTGKVSELPLQITGGTIGVMEAEYIEQETLMRMLLTTNRDGHFAGISVTESSTYVLEGQVKFDDFGNPGTLLGSYSNFSITGKLIDAGSVELWTSFEETEK